MSETYFESILSKFLSMILVALYRLSKVVLEQNACGDTGVFGPYGVSGSKGVRPPMGCEYALE